MQRIYLEKTSEVELLELARIGTRFTLVVENTYERPLTDLATVLATLAYANGAIIYQKGTPRRQRRSSTPLPKAALLPEQLSDNAIQDNERTEWQSLLALAITDPDAAAAKLLPAKTSVSYPTISQVLRIVPGGISTTYCQEFLSNGDLMTSGVAIFLDVDKGFNRKLCRCLCPGCSIFFLEIRGNGAPQRKYCREDHRDQAHKLGARSRAARARSGVRLRKTVEYKK